MMKSLSLLVLVLAASVIPSDAHASCLAGSALDSYAQQWFDDYEASFGLEVHCALSCLSGKASFECAHASEPIYWQGRGTQSCSYSATFNNFAIYIHPTTWQYTGSILDCGCSSGATFCHWR